jgi:hypothetical protein
MNLRGQAKKDAETGLNGWWLESTDLLELNHTGEVRKKREVEKRILQNPRPNLLRVSIRRYNFRWVCHRTANPF